MEEAEEMLKLESEESITSEATSDSETSDAASDVGSSHNLRESSDAYDGVRNNSHKYRKKKTHRPVIKKEGDVADSRYRSISAKEKAEASRWPVALQRVGCALFYTLHLLHPVRLLQLIAGIFNHINNFTLSVNSRTRRRRKLLSWLRQAVPPNQQVPNLTTVWRDGTILCSVIEAAIPGSCTELHRKQYRHISLQHAQMLASRHLGVQPMFTYEDLHQVTFSVYLERRLIRYLQTFRTALTQLYYNRNSLSRRLRNFGQSIFGFTSTVKQIDRPPPLPVDCVLKGMGLIVAVQERRSSFYIYFLQPQHSHLMRINHQYYDTEPADIAVFIRGPHGDYGEVIIQHLNPCKSSNYKSLNFSATKSNCNIPINYRLTNRYIRINYMPQSHGTHELAVLRRGYHLPGSPFLVTVDMRNQYAMSHSHGFSDDEDSPKNKSNRRRLRVMFRVVDFVTEKMLLTEDGRLEKLPVLISERILAYKTSQTSSDRTCSSSPDSVDNTYEHAKAVKQAIDYEPHTNSSASTTSPPKTPKDYTNVLRGRWRKVMLLCRFFAKQSSDHRRLQILRAAGHIFDGRPVRLTESTLKLIEEAVSGMPNDKDEFTFQIPAEETNNDSSLETELNITAKPSQCAIISDTDKEIRNQTSTLDVSSLEASSKVLEFSRISVSENTAQEQSMEGLRELYKSTSDVGLNVITHLVDEGAITTRRIACSQYRKHVSSIIGKVDAAELPTINSVNESICGDHSSKTAKNEQNNAIPNKMNSEIENSHKTEKRNLQDGNDKSNETSHIPEVTSIANEKAGVSIHRLELEPKLSSGERNGNQAAQLQNTASIETETGNLNFSFNEYNATDFDQDSIDVSQEDTKYKSKKQVLSEDPCRKGPKEMLYNVSSSQQSYKSSSTDTTEPQCRDSNLALEISDNTATTECCLSKCINLLHTEIPKECINETKSENDAKDHCGVLKRNTIKESVTSKMKVSTLQKQSKIEIECPKAAVQAMIQKFEKLQKSASTDIIKENADMNVASQAALVDNKDVHGDLSNEVELPGSEEDVETKENNQPLIKTTEDVQQFTTQCIERQLETQVGNATLSILENQVERIKSADINTLKNEETQYENMTSNIPSQWTAKVAPQKTGEEKNTLPKDSQLEALQQCKETCCKATLAESEVELCFPEHLPDNNNARNARIILEECPTSFINSGDMPSVSEIQQRQECAESRANTKECHKSTSVPNVNQDNCTRNNVNLFEEAVEQRNAETHKTLPMEVSNSILKCPRLGEDLPGTNTFERRLVDLEVQPKDIRISSPPASLFSGSSEASKMINSAVSSHDVTISEVYPISSVKKETEFKTAAIDQHGLVKQESQTAIFTAHAPKNTEDKEDANTHITNAACTANIIQTEVKGETVPLTISSFVTNDSISLPKSTTVVSRFTTTTNDKEIRNLNDSSKVSQEIDVKPLISAAKTNAEDREIVKESCIESSSNISVDDLLEVKSEDSKFDFISNVQQRTTMIKEHTTSPCFVTSNTAQGNATAPPDKMSIGTETIKSDLHQSGTITSVIGAEVQAASPQKSEEEYSLLDNSDKSFENLALNNDATDIAAAICEEILAVSIINSSTISEGSPTAKEENTERKSVCSRGGYVVAVNEANEVPINLLSNEIQESAVALRETDFPIVPRISADPLEEFPPTVIEADAECLIYKPDVDVYGNVSTKREEFFDPAIVTKKDIEKLKALDSEISVKTQKRDEAITTDTEAPSRGREEKSLLTLPISISDVLECTDSKVSTSAHCDHIEENATPSSDDLSSLATKASLNDEIETLPEETLSERKIINDEPSVDTMPSKLDVCLSLPAEVARETRDIQNLLHTPVSEIIENQIEINSEFLEPRSTLFVTENNKNFKESVFGSYSDVSTSDDITNVLKEVDIEPANENENHGTELQGKDLNSLDNISRLTDMKLAGLKLLREKAHSTSAATSVILNQSEPIKEGEKEKVSLLPLNVMNKQNPAHVRVPDNPSPTVTIAGDVPEMTKEFPQFSSLVTHFTEKDVSTLLPGSTHIYKEDKANDNDKSSIVQEESLVIVEYSGLDDYTHITSAETEARYTIIESQSEVPSSTSSASHSSTLFNNTKEAIIPDFTTIPYVRNVKDFLPLKEAADTDDHSTVGKDPVLDFTAGANRNFQDLLSLKEAGYSDNDSTVSKSPVAGSLTVPHRNVGNLSPLKEVADTDDHSKVSKDPIGDFTKDACRNIGDLSHLKEEADTDNHSTGSKDPVADSTTETYRNVEHLSPLKEFSDTDDHSEVSKDSNDDFTKDGCRNIRDFSHLNEEADFQSHSKVSKDPVADFTKYPYRKVDDLSPLKEPTDAGDNCDIIKDPAYDYAKDPYRNVDDLSPLKEVADISDDSNVSKDPVADFTTDPNRNVEDLSPPQEAADSGDATVDTHTVADSITDAYTNAEDLSPLKEVADNGDDSPVSKDPGANLATDTYRNVEDLSPLKEDADTGDDPNLSKHPVADYITDANRNVEDVSSLKQEVVDSDDDSHGNKDQGADFTTDTHRTVEVLSPLKQEILDSTDDSPVSKDPGADFTTDTYRNIGVFSALKQEVVDPGDDLPVSKYPGADFTTNTYRNVEVLSPLKEGADTGDDSVVSKDPVADFTTDAYRNFEDLLPLKEVTDCGNDSTVGTDTVADFTTDTYRKVEDLLPLKEVVYCGDDSPVSKDPSADYTIRNVEDLSRLKEAADTGDNSNDCKDTFTTDAYRNVEDILLLKEVADCGDNSNVGTVTVADFTTDTYKKVEDLSPLKEVVDSADDSSISKDVGADFITDTYRNFENLSPLNEVVDNGINSPVSKDAAADFTTDTYRDFEELLHLKEGADSGVDSTVSNGPVAHFTTDTYRNVEDLSPDNGDDSPLSKGPVADFTTDTYRNVEDLSPAKEVVHSGDDSPLSKGPVADFTTDTYRNVEDILPIKEVADSGDSTIGTDTVTDSTTDAYKNVEDLSPLNEVTDSGDNSPVSKDSGADFTTDTYRNAEDLSPPKEVADSGDDSAVSKDPVADFTSDTYRNVEGLSSSKRDADSDDEFAVSKDLGADSTKDTYRNVEDPSPPKKGADSGDNSPISKDPGAVLETDTYINVEHLSRLKEDANTRDDPNFIKDPVADFATDAYRNVEDLLSLKEDADTGDNSNVSTDPVADFATDAYRNVEDHLFLKEDADTGDHSSVSTDPVADFAADAYRNVEDHLSLKEDADTGDNSNVSTDPVADFAIDAYRNVEDHLSLKEDADTGDNSNVSKDPVADFATDAYRNVEDLLSLKEDADTGDHSNVSKDPVADFATDAYRNVEDLLSLKEDADTGDHSNVSKDPVADFTTDAYRNVEDLLSLKEDADTGDNSNVSTDPVADFATDAYRNVEDQLSLKEDADAGDHSNVSKDPVADFATDAYRNVEDLLSLKEDADTGDNSNVSKDPVADFAIDAYRNVEDHLSLKEDADTGDNSNVSKDPVADFATDAYRNVEDHLSLKEDADTGDNSNVSTDPVADFAIDAYRNVEDHLSLKEDADTGDNSNVSKDPVADFATDAYRNVEDLLSLKEDADTGDHSNVSKDPVADFATDAYRNVEDLLSLKEDADTGDHSNVSKDPVADFTTDAYRNVEDLLSLKEDADTGDNSNVSTDPVADFATDAYRNVEDQLSLKEDADAGDHSNVSKDPVADFATDAYRNVEDLLSLKEDADTGDHSNVSKDPVADFATDAYRNVEDLLSLKEDADTGDHSNVSTDPVAVFATDAYRNVEDLSPLKEVTDSGEDSTTGIITVADFTTDAYTNVDARSYLKEVADTVADSAINNHPVADFPKYVDIDSCGEIKPILIDKDHVDTISMIINIVEQKKPSVTGDGGSIAVINNQEVPAILSDLHVTMESSATICKNERESVVLANENIASTSSVVVPTEETFSALIKTNIKYSVSQMLPVHDDKDIEPVIWSTTVTANESSAFSENAFATVVEGSEAALSIMEAETSTLLSITLVNQGSLNIDTNTDISTSACAVDVKPTTVVEKENILVKDDYPNAKSTLKDKEAVVATENLGFSKDDTKITQTLVSSENAEEDVIRNETEDETAWSGDANERATVEEKINTDSLTPADHVVVEACHELRKTAHTDVTTCTSNDEESGSSGILTPFSDGIGKTHTPSKDSGFVIDTTETSLLYKEINTITLAGQSEENEMSPQEICVWRSSSASSDNAEDSVDVLKAIHKEAPMFTSCEERLELTNEFDYEPLIRLSHICPQQEFDMEEGNAKEAEDNTAVMQADLTIFTRHSLAVDLSVEEPNLELYIPISSPKDETCSVEFSETEFESVKSETKNNLSVTQADSDFICITPPSSFTKCQITPTLQNVEPVENNLLESINESSVNVRHIYNSVSATLTDNQSKICVDEADFESPVIKLQKNINTTKEGSTVLQEISQTDVHKNSAEEGVSILREADLNVSRDLLSYNVAHPKVHSDATKSRYDSAVDANKNVDTGDFEQSLWDKEMSNFGDISASGKQREISESQHELCEKSHDTQVTNKEGLGSHECANASNLVQETDIIDAEYITTPPSNNNFEANFESTSSLEDPGSKTSDDNSKCSLKNEIRKFELLDVFGISDGDILDRSYSTSATCNESELVDSINSPLNIRSQDESLNYRDLLDSLQGVNMASLITSNSQPYLENDTAAQQINLEPYGTIHNSSEYDRVEIRATKDEPLIPNLRDPFENHMPKKEANPEEKLAYNPWTTPLICSTAGCSPIRQKQPKAVEEKIACNPWSTAALEEIRVFDMSLENQINDSVKTPLPYDTHTSAPAQPKEISDQVLETERLASGSRSETTSAAEDNIPENLYKESHLHEDVSIEPYDLRKCSTFTSLSLEMLDKDNIVASKQQEHQLNSSTTIEKSAKTAAETDKTQCEVQTKTPENCTKSKLVDVNEDKSETVISTSISEEFIHQEFIRDLDVLGFKQQSKDSVTFCKQNLGENTSIQHNSSTSDNNVQGTDKRKVDRNDALFPESVVKENRDETPKMDMDVASPDEVSKEEVIQVSGSNTQVDLLEHNEKHHGAPTENSHEQRDNVENFTRKQHSSEADLITDIVCKDITILDSHSKTTKVGDSEEEQINTECTVSREVIVTKNETHITESVDESLELVGNIKSVAPETTSGINDITKKCSIEKNTSEMALPKNLDQNKKGISQKDSAKPLANDRDALLKRNEFSLSVSNSAAALSISQKDSAAETEPFGNGRDNLLEGNDLSQSVSNSNAALSISQEDSAAEIITKPFGNDRDDLHERNDLSLSISNSDAALSISQEHSAAENTTQKPFENERDDLFERNKLPLSVSNSAADITTTKPFGSDRDDILQRNEFSLSVSNSDAALSISQEDSAAEVATIEPFGNDRDDILEKNELVLSVSNSDAALSISENDSAAGIITSKHFENDRDDVLERNELSLSVSNSDTASSKMILESENVKIDKDYFEGEVSHLEAVNIPIADVVYPPTDDALSGNIIEYSFVSEEYNIEASRPISCPKEDEALMSSERQNKDDFSSACAVGSSNDEVTPEFVGSITGVSNDEADITTTVLNGHDCEDFLQYNDAFMKSERIDEINNLSCSENVVTLDLFTSKTTYQASIIHDDSEYTHCENTAENAQFQFEKPQTETGINANEAQMTLNTLNVSGKTLESNTIEYQNHHSSFHETTEILLRQGSAATFEEVPRLEQFEDEISITTCPTKENYLITSKQLETKPANTIKVEDILVIKEENPQESGFNQLMGNYDVHIPGHSEEYETAVSNWTCIIAETTITTDKCVNNTKQLNEHKQTSKMKMLRTNEADTSQINYDDVLPPSKIMTLESTNALECFELNENANVSNQFVENEITLIASPTAEAQDKEILECSFGNESTASFDTLNGFYSTKDDGMSTEVISNQEYSETEIFCDTESQTIIEAHIYSVQHDWIDTPYLACRESPPAYNNSYETKYSSADICYAQSPAYETQSCIDSSPENPDQPSQPSLEVTDVVDVPLSQTQEEVRLLDATLIEIDNSAGLCDEFGNSLINSTGAKETNWEQGNEDFGNFLKNFQSENEIIKHEEQSCNMTSTTALLFNDTSMRGNNTLCNEPDLFSFETCESGLEDVEAVSFAEGAIACNILDTQPCNSALAGICPLLTPEDGPVLASSPSQYNVETGTSFFPDLDDLLSKDFTTYMSSSGDQFHLWPSDVAFGSPSSNLDENIDFDSVLAAPNLEEALRKLEHDIQKRKEEPISDSAPEEKSEGEITDDKSVSADVENEDLSSSPSIPWNGDDNNLVEEVNLEEEGNLPDQANGQGEEDNLSYDIGDSDYVSLDDIQSSFKHSPESRDTDDSRNDSSYSAGQGEGEHDATASCRNRKLKSFEYSQEEREFRHMQGGSNAVISGFMGPAEREIWGILDGNGDSKDKPKECAASLEETPSDVTSTGKPGISEVDEHGDKHDKDSDENEEEESEIDWTAALSNVRCYPRVLSPGSGPSMSAIKEENEEDSSVTQALSVQLSSTETCTTKKGSDGDMTNTVSETREKEIDSVLMNSEEAKEETSILENGVIPEDTSLWNVKVSCTHEDAGEKEEISNEETEAHAVIESVDCIKLITADKMDENCDVNKNYDTPSKNMNKYCPLSSTNDSNKFNSTCLAIPTEMENKPDNNIQNQEVSEGESISFLSIPLETQDHQVLAVNKSSMGNVEKTPATNEPASQNTDVAGIKDTNADDFPEPLSVYPTKPKVQALKLLFEKNCPPVSANEERSESAGIINSTLFETRPVKVTHDSTEAKTGCMNPETVVLTSENCMTPKMAHQSTDDPVKYSEEADKFNAQTKERCRFDTTEHLNSVRNEPNNQQIYEQHLETPLINFYTNVKQESNIQKKSNDNVIQTIAFENEAESFTAKAALSITDVVNADLKAPLERQEELQTETCSQESSVPALEVFNGFIDLAKPMVSTAHKEEVISNETPKVLSNTSMINSSSITLKNAGAMAVDIKVGEHLTQEDISTEKFASTVDEIFSEILELKDSFDNAEDLQNIIYADSPDLAAGSGSANYTDHTSSDNRQNIAEIAAGITDSLKSRQPIITVTEPMNETSDDVTQLEGVMHSLSVPNSAGSAPTCIARRRQYWDDILRLAIEQKEAERKGKVSPQGTQKSPGLTHSEIYKKLCKRNKFAALRSRKPISVRVHGIVNKWRLAFETLKYLEENGNQSTTKTEIQTGSNVVEQWKKYWDNLVEEQAQIARYKELSKEEITKQYKAGTKRTLQVSGIVAVGRERFEKISAETVDKKYKDSVRKRRPRRLERNINSASPSPERNSKTNQSISVKRDSKQFIMPGSTESVNTAQTILLHFNQNITSDTRSSTKQVSSSIGNEEPAKTTKYDSLTFKATIAELDKEESSDLSVENVLEIQDKSSTTILVSNDSSTDGSKLLQEKIKVEISKLTSEGKENLTAEKDPETKNRFQKAKQFFQMLEQNATSKDSRPTPRHRTTGYRKVKTSIGPTSSREAWGSTVSLVEPRTNQHNAEFPDVRPSSVNSAPGYETTWGSIQSLEDKEAFEKKGHKGLRSSPSSSTESLSKCLPFKKLRSPIGGSERCAKVYEKFHVEDLFKDVVGEYGRNCGSLRGIPHKQAVLASLQSVGDRCLSPYDEVGSAATSDDEQPYERSMATSPLPQGYLPEYPYLSTTPAQLYRPRSSLVGSSLISRKDLLNVNKTTES